MTSCSQLPWRTLASILHAASFGAGVLVPPCRSVRGLAGVAADGLDRAFGIHPAWPCEVRTQFFIKTLLIPVLGGASSLQSVSSILHAVPIISPGYGPHADMQGGPKKLHLRCEHSGQPRIVEPRLQHRRRKHGEC